jgi:CO/xanthine dehydrogenase FAD-binding subunit
MHYDKFRLRDSVDFAIVSTSTLFSVEKGKINSAKIIFGGVAPVPIRAGEVEDYLLGREITEETADEACELAVKGSFSMGKNEYKRVEIKALLKNAILRLGQGSAGECP